MNRVILLVALCTLISAGCTSDGSGDGRDRTSTTTFAAPDFAPGSILFTRERRLRLVDGDTGAERHVADLGSADVAVSSDGAAVAYVGGAEPGEDFVEDPELTLLGVASGETSAVGPGLAPSFSPSADLLAYLQPAGPRRCEGEVCEGRTHVMMGVPGEEAEAVLDPGRWVALGWAGERLLVVDQDNPTGVQLVSAEGQVTRLDVSPGSVWGGSPEGNKLVLLAGDGIEIRGLDPDGLEEGRTLVALQGSLGQGAWSPDGGALAAVLLGPPRGGIPATELVIVAVDAGAGGRVETVPGSNGAQGPVHWARSGGALVYARSAPPRGLRLRAMLCADPPVGPCESVFSWSRGVNLLYLY